MSEYRVIYDINNIMNLLEKEYLQKDGFFKKLKNLLFRKKNSTIVNEEVCQSLEKKMYREVRSANTITDITFPNPSTNTILYTDFLTTMFYDAFSILENHGITAAEEVLLRYDNDLTVLGGDPFEMLIDLLYYTDELFSRSRMVYITNRLDDIYHFMKSPIISASVRKREFVPQSISDDTVGYIIAGIWCAITEKDQRTFNALINYWWALFVLDYIEACHIYYSFSERTWRQLEVHKEMLENSLHHNYEIMTKRFGDSISITKDSKFVSMLQSENVNKHEITKEWESIMNYFGFAKYDEMSDFNE